MQQALLNRATPARYHSNGACPYIVRGKNFAGCLTAISIPVLSSHTQSPKK
jgi:hypothetical protein